MDEIFKLLNPDNTMSLNRPLVHALGTNEAIIYSALIAKQLYYEKRGMLDDDGYFYSTIDDLKESTSLSKRQQSGAIKVLINAGLIDCKRRGIPGRRCFRVSDDIELLNKIIERGKSIMSELKPCQNVPTSGNKTAQQVGTKCNDKSEQNAPYTYNPNKETKVIKLNPSIDPDATDRTDISTKNCSSEERVEYCEIIRDNIDYEYQTEKEKIDEIVEIMLDVICSNRETVRVNGSEMPHEIVKSRFLKLDSSHIDYVLTAMKNSASEIRNIRAYLITALYNAPITIDNYYSALVNHDMRGS